MTQNHQAYARLWIRNGRILDPDRNVDESGDVLIEKNQIVDIAPRIAPANAGPGERVLDATDCWVTPGLVDIHTHLRDPGYEYKETIASGSESAVRGGFTSIVCMANTQPPNDNAAITEYILKKAREAGHARVFPVGTVTQGMQGQKLANFGDLREAGCVALSDDGKPVESSRMLRYALEYARSFEIPIISHCEDSHLFCGGHMNEGMVSTQLGIQGIPNAAEDIAVSRDIELASLSKGWLHLAHLSTSGSVRLLRSAKERGLRVTGEVTPHHFTLTDESVRGYDTNAKMNPPLRSEEDRQAVLEGLRDGVFDAIASDHAPHSIDEKEVEFEKAPFGIIGLETTVPLTMRLVEDGWLTPLQMIRLLTIGPARSIGLKVGQLRKGGLADVVVIDPKAEIMVDKERMASRSRNTPFHGWRLRGAVRFTVLDGEVRYEKGT